MLKRFNVSLLVAALAIFAVSCAGDKDADVREAAVNSINSVQPNATQPAANPAQPAQPAAPVGPTTSMTFEEMTYDFGSVAEGEKVRHVYKFKNTGDEPLVISNARGSCGCTVPQWPQEAIAPGESNEIVVEFNSKGKPGPQTKTVTITANTEPVTTKLTIKGTVEAGAKENVQVVQ
ncbi:MAG: DUF1573 domain-containing protein [Bacteroidota bacterium]